MTVEDWEVGALYWRLVPVQGASELTCTTMHGFCYQLIRVEASGSRDQAVALVRLPLPSRAGLHSGRGRDGEPPLSARMLMN